MNEEETRAMRSQKAINSAVTDAAFALSDLRPELAKRAVRALAALYEVPPVDEQARFAIEPNEVIRPVSGQARKDDASVEPMEGRPSMDERTASKAHVLLEQITLTINMNSDENRSNTPDFILAEFLMRMLDAGHELVRRRDQWYGIAPRPGNAHAVAPTPPDR